MIDGSAICETAQHRPEGTRFEFARQLTRWTMTVRQRRASPILLQPDSPTHERQKAHQSLTSGSSTRREVLKTGLAALAGASLVESLRPEIAHAQGSSPLVSRPVTVSGTLRPSGIDAFLTLESDRATGFIPIYVFG